MYATDARDYMVYPNWGTANNGWLYTSAGAGPPGINVGITLAMYQGGGLWAYSGTPTADHRQVYWCPVDVATTNTLAVRAGFTGAGQNAFSLRLDQMSTYVMNGAIIRFYPGPPAVGNPPQGCT